jgi:hypothetical protein
MAPARAFLVVLVLALAARTAAAAPPRLVSSVPADGASGVPADAGVLRLVFDQDMRMDAWTLWRSDHGVFPPLPAEPEEPYRSARTFEVPLGRLEPGVTYAVKLNSAAHGRLGFCSAAGEPLPDTTITFTAAAGKPPLNAPHGGAGGPKAQRAWTVLVHLAADNDLEAALLGNLNEQEAGLPEAGLEVIVLVDRAKGFDGSDGDWTETRRYRVRRGKDPAKIESELLESRGEANLGDPGVLAKFIATSLVEYPAERYALVLEGHGGGWPGGAVDFDAPGAEKGTDHLTLPELAAGIREGLDGAGVPAFDLVALDMCLMGQFEVAMALRPCAVFLLASEAAVPGRGLPYNLVLPLFTPDAPVDQIAADIVDVFGRHCGEVGEKAATLSALDLGRLDGVASALAALAARLGPVMDREWPSVSRSIFYAESYRGRTDFQKGREATASIDLLDAVKRIALRFPAAEPEYRALEQAVSAAVVAETAGRMRHLSRGLAVYGPVRGDMVRDEYASEAGAGCPEWLSLLGALHRAQSANLAAPKITSTRIVAPDGTETKSVTGLGGTHMEFTVEGSNILWATATQVRKLDRPEGYAVMARVLVLDPRFAERRAATAPEFADAVMPEYVDGKNVLRREVGGLGFKVTDGKTAFEATIDLSDLNDLAHVRVPAFIEQGASGRVLVDLFFDTGWSAVDSVVAHVEAPDGSVFARRIDPAPEAEITFLHEVVTSTGTTLVPTGKTRWGRGPELLPVFQEPGEYAMVLEAESIGGASDRVVVGYREEPDAGLTALLEQAGRWEPSELAGSWDLANGVYRPGATELDWQPTGVTLSFAKAGGAANVLTYEVRTAATAQSGPALVDLRGAPCIIYFMKDAVGNLVRSDFHLAFRQVVEGRPAFILKDVLLGNVYLLRKATGLPPPATHALVGDWASTDGVLMLFTEDRYQVFAEGRLYDQGRVGVTAAEVRFTSDSGGTVVTTYTLSGVSLALRWPDGVTRTFRRVE